MHISKRRVAGLLIALFLLSSTAYGWSGEHALSALEEKTLRSLAKVDEYPLYTMTYYGRYQTNASWHTSNALTSKPPKGFAPRWACSLFSAMGSKRSKVYGRNFDWVYSPALLLFTDPPDGYASVSMVDLAYLPFTTDELSKLTELPLVKRQAILTAVRIPFDGMNEHGLAVGMASVPACERSFAPDKRNISSVGIIREILDHARTVDEAVAIMEKYNIVMGNTAIHYLIAGPSGRSVVIELCKGKMHVIPGTVSWHTATNFLLNAAEKSPGGQCWRYDTMVCRLADTKGKLSPQGAMELLEKVSLPSTQWSIVYGMDTGIIDIAIAKKYNSTLHFTLSIIRYRSGTFRDDLVYEAPCVFLCLNQRTKRSTPSSIPTRGW